MREQVRLLAAALASFRGRQPVPRLPARLRALVEKATDVAMETYRECMRCGLPAHAALDVCLNCNRDRERGERFWTVGARVTSELHPAGPGVIEAIVREPTPANCLYAKPVQHDVLWDDGSRGAYFGHALDEERA